MEHNFREQGNSVKMNFGEHQNLFLGNKGEIAIFYREQGNIHPSWEASLSDMSIRIMHLYVLDRYLRTVFNSVLEIWRSWMRTPNGHL